MTLATNERVAVLATIHAFLVSFPRADFRVLSAGTGFTDADTLRSYLTSGFRHLRDSDTMTLDEVITIATVVEAFLDKDDPREIELIWERENRLSSASELRSLLQSAVRSLNEAGDLTQGRKQAQRVHLTEGF